MNTLEQRLLTLQQQLEQLNAEVASLLAIASTVEPAGKQRPAFSSSPKRPASTSSVGLNRFHQLANEAV